MASNQMVAYREAQKELENAKKSGASKETIRRLETAVADKKTILENASGRPAGQSS